MKFNSFSHPVKLIATLFILLVFSACKKQAGTPATQLPPKDTTTLSSTKWWNDAVFYELFVRSFYDQDGDGIGDFKGLTQKLDYLNDGNPATSTDLGITAIWLMPIMQSASYHGYDVTDYRTIEKDYGTNQDFQTFIAAAHQRGIKVIIDYVMNHTSDQHPWFIQSEGDVSSTYRNWYRWSASNPGDLGFSGEPVWYFHNSAYYYGLFNSGMPDLNYQDPAVKTEMFDIARFWLQDMNVDGFRLDAARYIVEQQGGQQEDTDSTLQFWHDFRTSFKAVNPNAMAVGEVWASTAIASKYVQSDRLDFCFEFDLAGYLVNAVNSGNGSSLAAQMDLVKASYPSLQYGTFLTNHDQERVMTTLGGDVTKAKLACSLLLTLPGVPFIYYGEEIGTIGSKPDINIRTPLQWNINPNAGFTTNFFAWTYPQADYVTKNIAAEQGESNSLWNTYRKLISIRNNQPALRRGEYTSMMSNDGAAFVFLRKYENDYIIVASNLDGNPVNDLQVSLQSGTLPQGSYTLDDQVTGASHPLTVDATGGFSSQGIGNLDGRTTAIYKLRKD